jgi:hypothetical protein
VLATSVRVSPRGDRIAIGGVKSKPKDDDGGGGFVELGLFSLPPKLLSSCPVEQGLNNKRDFTLVAGARDKKDRSKIKQVMGHCLTLGVFKKFHVSAIEACMLCMLCLA